MCSVRENRGNAEPESDTEGHYTPIHRCGTRLERVYMSIKANERATLPAGDESDNTVAEQSTMMEDSRRERQSRIQLHHLFIFTPGHEFYTEEVFRL